MKYNEKNLKICKILGAEQFQKIVFILEKAKYQIIEKFFPNILKWYDDYSKKSLRKKLLKCDRNKQKKVIDEYRFSRLSFKKELVYKQNQNYHLDLDNPTFFVNYLRFNRRIHIDGLIANVAFIILAILFKILFIDTLNILVNVLLVYNLISSFINFQCINLQNYNLCRLENDKMKELLKKREKRIKEEKIKAYGEGMKVIERSFQETIEIPSFEDILSNIKTNEEKKQLLLYLKKQLEILERQNNENNLQNKGRCKVR